MLVFFTAKASPGLKITGAPIVHHQLKTDSTKLAPRKLNEAAINNYKKDPDFNYHTHKTEATLWERFWGWVWDVWTNFWLWVGGLLEKLFGRGSGRNVFPVIKYLILGIGAFMIVYIVFKLLGIDLLRLFRKKQDNKAVPNSLNTI